MAKVSIKYKQKTRGTRQEVVKTEPVDVLIVVLEAEGKRVLKFKQRIISKIIKELSIKEAKVIDPDINSIEIIKDVGQTNYEV